MNADTFNADSLPRALSPERLAEIAERTPKRAAALTAWLDQFSPTGGDQRALENAETVLEEDVPALLAEVGRLKTELAGFSGRVNELESRLCTCEPAREHDDYRRPAFYQHEPHCRVTELTTPPPADEGGAQ
ncbi:hypothetical protein QFZ63_001631 [Streptomyces sp. B3I7]|uniref:hypothetical protein n=1 Tax=Streptomyces sp. B3I7 TaxID=3042269 RepID=UPI00278A770C|nr:hypothetical protein [Streptomyces sp. B3I7]MDQ0809917.1 hypothetical protein [Streptomyces sp. B3I7]